MLVVVSSSISHADTPAERVVISPTVHLLGAFRSAPPPFVRKGIVDEDGFLGSLRFAEELSPEEQADLESLGVGLQRDNGRVVHVGPIYPAWIRWANLDAVVRAEGLLQLDTEFIARMQPALETTRPQTGSPALAQQIELATGKRAGEGVRIMDLDDGLDPFHPAFFHADGGYYSWLDVDGNGVLTLGLDAVDLDGDGEASEPETLAYVDISYVEIDSQDWYYDYEAGNGKFDVGEDWLFADTNGDGYRNFGPDWGYYDATPGFGEPILLLDDVNRNGAAELEEKLVLLGTSKIAVIQAHGIEYERGKNLAELDTSIFDSYGYVAGGFHGTGVSGILVANTPGLTRHVGMAPYADLYLADEYSTHQGWGGQGMDSLIGKLDWARVKEIDVIVMPLGLSGYSFMDGSTNFELAMDELFLEEGIITVVAAGNEGGAGKHMQTILPPGESTEALIVPEELPDYFGYPYQGTTVILSFYWYGNDDDVVVNVALPGMEAPVELVDSQGWQDDGTPLIPEEMSSFCRTSKSFTGLIWKMCYFYPEKMGSLVPIGNWQFSFDNTTDGDLALHGFATDEYGSHRSILYENWESVDSTMTVPATANSAISVAAYAGRDPGDEGLDKIRNYSSRGPRIDGELAMEIAGPDDPMTPLSTMGEPGSQGGKGGFPFLFGSYMPFGGTSGASPHVAGSLALLVQQMPDAPAQEVVNALLAGALQEEFMGELPNKEWGYGKVNVYQSVFGPLPEDNGKPQAVATLVSRNGLTATLDASESTDPEGSALLYRWDFEYDGKWNMPWIDTTHLEYTFAQAGTVTVKLAVRDEGGAVDEVLLAFPVDPDSVWPEPVEPPAGDLGSQPDVFEEVAAADAPAETKKARSGCDSGPGRATPYAMPVLLAMTLLILLAVRRRRARHKED